ncbi:MAG: hypothetical protein M4579_000513 [Chaenotheca gracillima]|nr:MAG: hypothetical protein M4579_000513 [Chaenotheca gracillima]
MAKTRHTSNSAPGRDVKRPPSYYRKLRQDLAVQGRTPAQHSDATKKSERSLWRKWERFCHELSETPEAFLIDATAADYKTFLKWTLDRYRGIKASSTFDLYWRVLKMHYLERTGHLLNESVCRDVTNYKKVLRKEHKLRRFTRAKPVAYLDDLYEVLIALWVWDDTVFADERQRQQVATGLLMAAYFGCRPCSMFDTRIKFKDLDDIVGTNSNENLESIENGDQDMEKNTSSDDDTPFNSPSAVDDEMDLSGETMVGDSSDSGSDSGTDDGFDAGTDEMVDDSFSNRVNFRALRPSSATVYAQD